MMSKSNTSFRNTFNHKRLKGTIRKKRVKVRNMFNRWLCVCVCVCVSCYRHVQLFATLCTRAHQAPLFMGFSRHEYWSGLPCSPLGHLSDPGIQLFLLCLLHWQVGSLPLASLRKPIISD